MSDDPEQASSTGEPKGTPEDYAAKPDWFFSDVPEFYADTVHTNMGP